MDEWVIHRYCCAPLKVNSMNAQKAPLWFWISATLGLLWNLFGLFRFSVDSFSSVEKLIAGGMTQAQASLYAGLPFWMTVVFAVGVIGGTLGCILLLLRKKQALAVFAVSLVGYIALYAGDIALGVFAAFGTPQVVILTTVVLIAVALLWLARLSQQRFWLS
jgi:hypothetical protein